MAIMSQQKIRNQGERKSRKQRMPRNDPSIYYKHVLRLESITADESEVQSVNTVG
jgi:hypothetical protein